MKKMMAVLLIMAAAVMAFGCGAAKTDSEYVKSNKKLVVGITDFAPMDYQDSNGNWIGFDADCAKLFADKVLGVGVEFVEIDWDNKSQELSGKNIDCVWNGMTLSDEVKASMDCSEAYCNNAQTVVVKKENASTYNSINALKELTFAVEAGSAGEAVVKELGFKYVPVQTQADTLLEVSAGTSDASVIDALMAAAMVGEGTGYSGLTYTIGLNSEEYGVGFRKGSDLTAMLNKFFDDYKKDVMEIAKKYGVEASIIQ
ncbi:MAG: transporter substrate-binding domain-containing protein [Lachnospiraceae bacterium]|nr:transporter substrate-binding domain-containing protein [Lachnospiraceae bacterium]